MGGYYNPCPDRGDSAYGDLGTIQVENDGRSKFRLENDVLKLSDIIGRSLVISEMNNDVPNRISCGIIARSSGLFENPKTICLCDGITIWDETKKPLPNP